jgi:hypothetical protein
MRKSYGRNFKFRLLRKGLKVIKCAENFSSNGPLNYWIAGRINTTTP